MFDWLLRALRSRVISKRTREAADARDQQLHTLHDGVDRLEQDVSAFQLEALELMEQYRERLRARD